MFHLPVTPAQWNTCKHQVKNKIRTQIILLRASVQID